MVFNVTVAVQDDQFFHSLAQFCILRHVDSMHIYQLFQTISRNFPLFSVKFKRFTAKSSPVLKVLFTLGRKFDDQRLKVSSVLDFQLTTFSGVDKINVKH